jgi:hypothetical protein
MPPKKGAPKKAAPKKAPTKKPPRQLFPGEVQQKKVAPGHGAVERVGDKLFD